MLNLILAFIGLALLISGLTYTLFWYEHAASPHRRRLDELSSGRPVLLVLRCVLVSSAAQILMGLLYPLGPLLPRLLNPRRPAPSPLPPVLLLHGLYHNSSAWPILLRLHRAGFRNIYLRNLNTWTKDIETLEKEARGWIRDISGRHSSKVALVGHSLGGLLIRLCLADTDTSGRTLAAVVMAAPHGGSRLAVFGLGRAARDLVPGSRTVRRAASSRLATPLPCLSLRSPLDNMVLPTEATRVQDPAWQEEELPPLSHISVLYHVPTADRIAAFLRTAATSMDA